jgi:hypothetical protein
MRPGVLVQMRPGVLVQIKGVPIVLNEWRSFVKKMVGNSPTN